MISNPNDLSVYSSTAFDEKAEMSLISNMLKIPEFQIPSVERRLGLYPVVMESEKDIIILELMDYFWNVSSCKGLFSVFRDFDMAFTILEKKGHFIHSFEVFLLGLHLINIIIEKRGVKPFASIGNDKSHIFYSWLYTSTAHDFGYPLQVAGELAEKFSALYKSVHMDHISDKYKNLSRDNSIERQHALLNTKAYNMKRNGEDLIKIEDFIKKGIQGSLAGKSLKDANQIQSILKNNHGYIGALILCKTYIDYLSKESKWEYQPEIWRTKILSKVVAGIALHSFPKAHHKFLRKISFNLNPLAYLLILVDNLQDWNRSLRSSKAWPAYYLSEFQTNDDSLVLQYHLFHERWSRSMKERVKKSLGDRLSLLKLPQGPIPKINFKIIIRCSSNDGDNFTTSTIIL